MKPEMQLHIPKRTLLLYRVTLVFIAFVFAVIIYAIYLLIFPLKVVQIRQPVEVTSSSVVAGQIVEYRVHECRFVHLPSHVVRRMISQSSPSLYLPLGSSDNDPPTGCRDFSPSPIVIPVDTPPGKYKIEFDVSIPLNPLRTFNETTYSNTFTVLPPPTGKQVVVEQIIYSGVPNSAGQQKTTTTTTTTNTPAGSYAQPSTTNTKSTPAPNNPAPQQSPAPTPQPKPNPVTSFLQRNIVQPIQKLLQ